MCERIEKDEFRSRMCNWWKLLGTRMGRQNKVSQGHPISSMLMLRQSNVNGVNFYADVTRVKIVKIVDVILMVLWLNGLNISGDINQTPFSSGTRTNDSHFEMEMKTKNENGCIRLHAQLLSVLNFFATSLFLIYQTQILTFYQHTKYSVNANYQRSWMVSVLDDLCHSSSRAFR